MAHVYIIFPFSIVTAQFGYGLAFTTGLLGALHCLGMCGGLASGCAVANGKRQALLALLQYHATRIALYTLFGVAGALAGRVLVQAGIIGKTQGIVMMGAGLLVMAIGLRLLWRPDARALPRPFQQPRLPWIGGLLNGLVPCSLVFSVAVQAAASADPARAALIMLTFGLGTLPTMASVSLLGGAIGAVSRGPWMRLAGLSVFILGGWTLWEGWVFFDIMRGLANW